MELIIVAFSLGTEKQKSLVIGLITRLFRGAADRDRTGTVFLPRDFKSLASACSATAADKTLIYFTIARRRCQLYG